MGVQGSVSFFFDGVSQPVAADHHHRIEVMRLGAVFFALGRGKLDLGHVGIIGHEGENERKSQKQQGQSGVDQ